MTFPVKTTSYGSGPPFVTGDRPARFLSGYHEASEGVVNGKVPKAAALLFGSGFAALVYETVWIRQFRLIFGASTASTAAVLAVYLGGLGIGSVVLGTRADRNASPFRLYAMLEAIAAATAALTPLFIAGARIVYINTGGSSRLATFGSTVVRLILSAIVLAAPTVAIGGTLPAISRAVTDMNRKAIAVLYGINTLGGCAGVIVATFFAIERFGHRNTLWLACATNGIVAGSAWLLSRPASPAPAAEEKELATAGRRDALLPAISAVTGFVFLLMEIVWYRELVPLVGGTTYSFGTILVVALFGIGAGGAISSAFEREKQPALEWLGIIIAAQAICLILPFAAGDHLATAALLVHPATSVGFGARVIYMVCVVTAVVLLPAVFSGMQLPMIIAMRGRGRERAGSDVGLIVGLNTLGSIAGSLAGGFGILPLLGANGSWRLSGALLIALAFAVVFVARARTGVAAVTVVANIAVAAMLFTTGPTAVWRQTPIGAGRADQTGFTKNSLRNFERFRRRTILWSRDGVESDVALSASDGLAFVINGQTDGHSRFDAGTQVMSGLLGALLHPRPRTAFVVGLGTGSTAGWLGAVPGMERVDVVELEPVVRDVADACTAVNADPLRNPKVHLTIGDAREALLTSRERYDLIASEPSNPSRAGIASFFTADFYRACSNRLNPSGMFLQWLQGYEIDARTVRIVYATLLSVFPHVETWETKHGDLLLVGSMSAPAVTPQQLRQRMQSEPYRSALFDVWRATTIENIAARFVAGERVARDLSRDMALNTDDKPAFEFALARTLGTTTFNVDELRGVAAAAGDDSPPFAGIGPAALDNARVSMSVAEGQDPANAPLRQPQARVRATAASSYLHFDYRSAVNLWSAQGAVPQDPVDIAIFAESLADSGDARASAFIDHLHVLQPVEADVLLARLRHRQGDQRAAAMAMADAFRRYTADAWPLPVIMTRAFPLAIEIATAPQDRSIAATLFDACQKPFAAMMFNEARLSVMLQLAAIADGGQCGNRTQIALAQLEPHAPWIGSVLRARAQCGSDPAAIRDYRKFLAAEPQPLVPQE